MLILCLAALMLICCCAVCSAESETGPLKISMDMSNNRFTGPGDVTITIKVTNTAETDMPGPVTLYYPDGHMVEEFGNPTLAAGQSNAWTGTWAVTQDELDKGRITFALAWYELNDAGEPDQKAVSFYKTIIYTEAEPDIEVNRIIVPSMAKEGQEVSVTYEIVNKGTVDITNVIISEHKDVSKTTGNLDVVPAGERRSYTFTVKMGKKNLTSSAAITYRAGNTTGTIRKEETVIKRGEVKLNATLTADKKGGMPGDAVKLTLTLKNTGSVDYQNVTVTDSLLGEVFTGLTVAAGKTVTQEKEISITGSADYQFVVTGQDTDGNSVETATGRVSVVQVDPTQALNLAVTAELSRVTLERLPSVVRVTIAVTNNGASEAKNVRVVAAGTTLHTFSTLQPGETRRFERDLSLSMAGQYRFDAVAANELGEDETFSSEIIYVQYAPPTAAPTDEPVVTPAPPVYEPIPTTDDLPEYIRTMEKLVSVLNQVFVVLGGICLVLLAIGVVRRIQANRRAKDHLERSSTRTYDMPAPKGGRKAAHKDEQPDESDGEAADAPSADEEAAARDGERMEETLRQLYPRGDQPSSAEEVGETAADVDQPADQEAPADGKKEE